MFYVYVLWSERLGKRYVGSAKDSTRRLAQHNEGQNRFTKSGIPWVIIHTEEYPDLPSARKRESFLKSGIGRSWLDTQFPQFKKKK